MILSLGGGILRPSETSTGSIPTNMSVKGPFHDKTLKQEQDGGVAAEVAKPGMAAVSKTAGANLGSSNLSLRAIF